MRVRVVAPARRLDREVAARLEELTKRDFPSLDLEIDEQCFAQAGHFAGSDEERARALIRAMGDDAVDAVWFARGGYGSCRLLDAVLTEMSPRDKKPFVLGYSDTGYLLAAFYTRQLGRSVHAPMPADLLRGGGEAAVSRTLAVLSGDSAGTEPSSRNEPTIALNLSILASLAAGPHLPDLRGRVVQIEEVSEHLYAIDRALFTIISSGRLGGAKGIRLGRISDIPENDIPFGEKAEEIVRKWAEAASVPYLGRADIGHDSDNKVVVFR
jgi:muramoyltetrapeptide carboxypeptidase